MGYGLFLLVASGIGLAAPGRAREADCAHLRAIAGADGAGLAAVGWGVENGTGIYFTVGRRRVDLARAAECTLNAVPEATDIGCQWDYPAFAAASAAYDALLGRLRACTAAPLAPVEHPVSTPAWRVLRENVQTFESRSGDTEIKLSLVEYPPPTQADRPSPVVRYLVGVDIVHDNRDDGEDAGGVD
jgi:hypothetical protein